MTSLGRDISTLPSGDIIELTRAILVQDSEAEKIAYKGRWVPGQNGSSYDPMWTLADLFGFDPERYQDVTTYVSYEVTVFFEGRNRTYRAVAFFHGGDVAKPIKISFWDAIVGRGASATLSIEAEPEATEVQWYRGLPGDRSNPVLGASSPVFHTPPIDRVTTFWAEIETSCGVMMSNAATVKVESRRRAARHP